MEALRRGLTLPPWTDPFFRQRVVLLPRPTHWITLAYDSEEGMYRGEPRPLGCAICGKPPASGESFCSPTCTRAGSDAEGAGERILEALAATDAEKWLPRVEALLTRYRSFRRVQAERHQEGFREISRRATELDQRLQMLLLDQDLHEAHLEFEIRFGDKCEEWSRRDQTPEGRAILAYLKNVASEGILTHSEILSTLLGAVQYAAEPRVGPRPKRATLALIRGLAGVWSAKHGSWPSRSYDAHQGQESGRFLEFVKACLEALPDDERIKVPTGLIRTVCDEDPGMDVTDLSQADEETE